MSLFRRLFTTVAVGKDMPWYERLQWLHPELDIHPRRHTLTQAEALVTEARGMTRAEMYDLHPDLFAVLSDDRSLPEGFPQADGRLMLWSLALVRYWFDRPLLVDGDAAGRMTNLVLHAILKAGEDPSGAECQRELSEVLGDWYARSAALVAADCPDDIDPLTFCVYTKACGADIAARMIRENIPLEYAGAV